MTNRFLRIMINLAVSHSLKHEAASQQPTQLSYLALDGFVRLVILLVNGTTYCNLPHGHAHLFMTMTQMVHWNANMGKGMDILLRMQIFHLAMKCLLKEPASDHAMMSSSLNHMTTCQLQASLNSSN